MARKNKNSIGFSNQSIKTKRSRLFGRKSKGRYSGTHVGFTGDMKQPEVKTPFRDNWKFAQDSVRAGVGGLRLIIAIIFSILLVSLLIRTLTGNGPVPTFAGFLSYLQDAPEVQIPFINYNEMPISGADWGIFEFARLSIVFILESINIFVFFVNGLISVVTYVIFLFRWLFAV